MNEIINTLITQRSCKSFQSTMVPEEIIQDVVEAGLYAASALNQQSPIILVVTSKETRDQLSRLNAKYDPRKRPDPFYNAPVVLVVLAPKNAPTGIYDGSLVLGNMMTAAFSLGIGSCWIHRAKETFEDGEGKQIFKSLGIQEEYEGIGNCILGYPEHINTNIPPRRENRVFKI